MALADAQQQRQLELLREVAEEPTPFAELHAGGVSFPAAVISELELNGYPIERVYDHTPPLAKAGLPQLVGIFGFRDSRFACKSRGGSPLKARIL
jgi:hypothetical protein